MANETETTSYEAERLANIRRNEEMMRSLGVWGGAAAVVGGAGEGERSPASAGAGGGRGSSSRNGRKGGRGGKGGEKGEGQPQKREARPVRSSARLAGHEADSDTLKRKYEVS